MPLETSSVMFLESSGVSGLSASYILLQATQLRLIRSQLVSSWLTSYFAPHGSPLLSHSHLEAFSAALVVLRMAHPFLTPSMTNKLCFALHLACGQPRISPLYLVSVLSQAFSRQSSM